MLKDLEVTFKSEVRFQDKLYAAALDLVCQTMKLLSRQSHAKVRNRHWISVDSVVDAGSIVALDFMADNLMAKEGVVHPSRCASSFLASHLAAKEWLAFVYAGSSKRLTLYIMQFRFMTSS